MPVGTHRAFGTGKAISIPVNRMFPMIHEMAEAGSRLVARATVDPVRADGRVGAAHFFTKLDCIITHASGSSSTLVGSTSLGNEKVWRCWANRTT